MVFPTPVPEIPTQNVDEAVAYYVGALGFTLDWGGEEGGIAGISRGHCRLFLTNPAFRRDHGNGGPVMTWINLGGREAVDALCAEWRSTGASLLSEPEDRPWKLREFMASDPDGNLLRVFYDFSRDA